MKVIPTDLPGVLIIEPKIWGDARGFFFESFHRARYAALGIAADFVQDNFSRSVKGTLRGLHFQEPRAQGKLVQVIDGAVFDVAVDIRVGSPHFGKWISVDLSGDNKRQLWVPTGFAHGFCVVSDTATFIYKCTDLYAPECERGVIWNDPDLAIPWPTLTPLVSAKDAALPALRGAPLLPRYDRPP